MSEESADISPFAAARMPSSALIDKLLRSLPEGPPVPLGEQTVDTYCRRLRESARLLSDLDFTKNPADHAESYRYLLTMTAYAVDAALLNPGPLEPMFSQPYRLHLLDWGAASPDSVYRRAMVRDDRAYRVHGRIGNAWYLSMDFRQSSPARTITREELANDAEGNFEIFIGGPERAKDWWPMHPGTTGILVREFFDDWLSAEKSRLRIECLDGELAPAPGASKQPGRRRVRPGRRLDPRRRDPLLDHGVESPRREPERLRRETVPERHQAARRLQRMVGPRSGGRAPH